MRALLFAFFGLRILFHVVFFMHARARVRNTMQYSIHMHTYTLQTTTWDYLIRELPQMDIKKYLVSKTIGPVPLNSKMSEQELQNTMAANEEVLQEASRCRGKYKRSAPKNRQYSE